MSVQRKGALFFPVIYIKGKQVWFPGHSTRAEAETEEQRLLTERGTVKQGRPQAAAPKLPNSTGNDCVEWPLSTMPNGYGQVGRSIDGKKMTLYAHRYIWEQANGPIPAGMEVMHACDNPKCVNLAHLSLGTHVENMQDMAAKGRGRKPSSLENSLEEREQDSQLVEQEFAF